MRRVKSRRWIRSEEHTSELQSLTNLVCRLLLEKKNLISYLICAPVLLMWSFVTLRFRAAPAPYGPFIIGSRPPSFFGSPSPPALCFFFKEAGPPGSHPFSLPRGSSR